MYARQQPHPPSPEHPPPPPPPLPPDEPYLPPAPPPGNYPSSQVPQPLFDDLPPRPLFTDTWNPNQMSSFHDNQAPPPYGNYDSRYNPPDVTMPTYQQRPHHGHMTYRHPDPLFPPRDVPFHSYPIEPQLTQPGYYDNRHFQANNPYLSQVNFPYWRDRSPEKVPPRQELWPQVHPYVHDRGEPHPFHGPLLETHDLPPTRILGGVQRPGDVAMTMTKIVPAETIFDMPGRTERPSHIVIILRGLPGSGKSHLAKLMKEKEVHYSSSAPRILSIDDYFINEVEKKEKDPDTGRMVKKKVEEYEYDVTLEPSYLASMLKQFNKTLTEGYFTMIIVDAVNSKISEFDQFWSNSKMKGFESFVVELKESIEVCIKRNIHERTKEEIELLASCWEATPPHFLQLDVTSLLSPNDTTINEVDMEMVDSDQEDDKEESKFKIQTNWMDSRFVRDTILTMMIMSRN